MQRQRQRQQGAYSPRGGGCSLVANGTHVWCRLSPLTAGLSTVVGGRGAYVEKKSDAEVRLAIGPCEFVRRTLPTMPC